VIRRHIVLAAALLLGVAQLAAQDGRLSDRLSIDAARDVQALVDSAEASGLPTEPLVDLALEGAAKGATDPRIVSAVGRLHDALATSRATLGAEASNSEVTIGAYAIRQGLSREHLAQLRLSRQGDLTVPLGAALDLAGRGVAPDSAATVVAQLAQRGEDETIKQLVREVDRSLAGGLSPDEAWHSARLRVGP